eukprot:12224327-Heterocapsa_arctica.AAC.1
MEVTKERTCAPLKTDGLEFATVTWPVSQDWKTEWKEGMSNDQEAEDWNGKPFDIEGKIQEGGKE